MIHHNNCTYCQHRKRIFVGQGKSRKPKEIEKCGLTDRTVPAPFTEGLRYCEHYQQVNCTCQLCVQPINQLANTIDTG